MKDTIQRGTTAGLIGVAGDLCIYLAFYYILGTSTAVHYISQLIFPFKEVTIVKFIYGLIVHSFAGGLTGIALVLLFKFFGNDKPLIKGTGLGILFWIFHVLIIPNMVTPRPYLFRTELEAGVDLISHLAFSLIATYYLIKNKANNSRF